MKNTLDNDWYKLGLRLQSCGINGKQSPSVVKATIITDANGAILAYHIDEQKLEPARNNLLVDAIKKDKRLGDDLAIALSD